MFSEITKHREMNLAIKTCIDMIGSNLDLFKQKINIQSGYYEEVTLSTSIDRINNKQLTMLDNEALFYSDDSMFSNWR